jgi:hypothetical protein
MSLNRIRKEYLLAVLAPGEGMYVANGNILLYDGTSENLYQPSVVSRFYTSERLICFLEF